MYIRSNIYKLSVHYTANILHNVFPMILRKQNPYMTFKIKREIRRCLRQKKCVWGGQRYSSTSCYPRRWTEVALPARKSPRCPINRTLDGPQSQPGRSADQKNALLYPTTEPGPSSQQSIPASHTKLTAPSLPPPPGQKSTVL